ncbi:MAG: multi antimicrobial extrusion protein MatE [Acidimicrobiales bacterium]|nr:multi antimicrobial extrusion protein MatE [Acidimicrobiales bacterium]
MLRGSVWILGVIGLQTFFGALFWFLASKVASTSDLGKASALFSGIQFVNYASGLGLTTALARYVTDTSAEADALFGWGVVATTISSLIAGGIYLVVVSSPATNLISHSVLGWVVFIAVTVATSIGLLTEVRLMAGRRWGWLAARVLAAGLIRIPFVFIDMGKHETEWLFALMLVPLAVVGIGSLPLLRWIGEGRSRFHRPEALVSVARYAGVNWVASLAFQAPQFALPLIVALSVRPEVNANFFVAWTVTGVVFLAPSAISQVLLVEGAKTGIDEAGGARRAREALGYSLGLSTLAWVVSVIGSSIVVSVFGDGYRATARIMPSLMLAGIPWSIAAMHLAQARIRRDQLATVAITVTLGLGILVPALLWVPHHQGTEGATRAWLLGNVAAAVVAVLLRRLRHRPEPVALLQPA